MERGAKILGGNALQPTATATSVRADIMTDGPFVETKEVLGGYYLIEANDLDSALAIAKLCPAYFGGVEVRPILDTSGGQRSRAARLYDELHRVWPSPVVRLNRTVAVAMVAGPGAALAEIAALEQDGRLDGYHYLSATKADLLRRLGRHPEAADACQRTLDCSENATERAFLERRLTECRQYPTRDAGSGALDHGRRPRWPSTALLPGAGHPATDSAGTGGS